MKNGKGNNFDKQLINIQKNKTSFYDNDKKRRQVCHISKLSARFEVCIGKEGLLPDVSYEYLNRIKKVPLKGGNMLPKLSC